MKKDNENKADMQTVDTASTDSALRQITITLKPDGKVVGMGPTDMKVLFFMLGEFLKQLGLTLEFKPPSPIIKPPLGMKVKP